MEDMMEREEKFEEMRRKMVERQIVARGIRDGRVIRAMLKVPRHFFVPEHYRNEAYNDYPLPIGHGQTISQPYMVAVMTEALELNSDHKVLEIGTGSGYQTAILAEIAREVYSVERVKELAERAETTLKSLGYKNVHIKVGDGTLGWEEHAPYDRIIVTAAAPDIPRPLIDQLNPYGIIVIPLGGHYLQTLVKARKLPDGTVFREEMFSCAFVPLIGKHGF